MDAPVIHILIDDDGHPRTINRRVKVHMLASKYLAGVTADALVDHYGITHADVYAALAYYHDNRAYFDAREAALKPLINAAEKRSATLRAKVERRLAENDTDA